MLIFEELILWAYKQALKQVLKFVCFGTNECPNTRLESHSLF